MNDKITGTSGDTTAAESPSPRKRRLGLLPRILIAMALGIGAGMVSPEWGGRLMATFDALFAAFLNFMIPLIIVGFVTPAIADTGRRAPMMLLATAALAYLATVLAGLMSYACGTAVFPSLISSTLPLAATEAAGITPWFTLEISPLCTVTTALVLAFVLGLCMARFDSPRLRGLAYEMRTVVEMTIKGAVIPLLPIYIFGIFLCMTLDGQVAAVLRSFVWIVAVIFCLHVLLLLLQYGIAGAIGGRNPLKMLRTMLPAYFTALGTQSSAATIPVTLRQTIKMGVNEDVAGFVIPLCATIHLSGSTLKIVACALALTIMQGLPHDVMTFAGFIAMLGVTMVAAPGIPGGAIMAALGVLQSMLGFSEQQCALMIALYIAMDSFGTACNVTGDGAIAVIINRFFGKRVSSAASDGEESASTSVHHP